MSESARPIHQGWTSRLPLYSLLLLAASLGLPQVQFPFFGVYVVAADLVFLLTIGLFFVAVLLRRRSIVFHWFYWALAGYLAAMLISSLFSIDKATSLQRFFEEGYLIGLAVVAINALRSSRDIKLAIAAWLVGSSVAFAIGFFTIVLFYTQPGSPLLEPLTYHYGSVPVGNYPRLTAGFVSASMLCNYLNVSLVLVLYARHEGWLSIRSEIVLLTAVAIVSVFTFSIGLGGIALGLGVWISLRSATRTLRLAGLSGGALIAVSFLLISFFALAHYPHAHVIAAIPGINVELMPSARVLVWSEAIVTFLSNPVTGLGLGLPVAGVLFENSEGSSSVLTDAHNSFLSVAAQNGVIGLTAFVYLIAAILRRWRRELITAVSPNGVTAIGLAFLCSFVYQGLTGSFEDARHLWVLIGMFWAADNIQTRET